MTAVRRPVRSSAMPYLRSTARMGCAVAVVCSVLLDASWAATKKEEIRADALGRIVMLDGGRQKPLDTYARTKLVQFSGRKDYRRVSAVQWFARVLFNPASADHDKVFLINNPELADAVGIAPEKKRRYSYAQLYAGSEKLRSLARQAMGVEQQQRSTFETEVLRVYGNFQEYMRLSSVFSFLLPYEGFDISDSTVAARLQLDVSKGHASFLELISRAALLSAAMKDIQAKGPGELSDSEIAILGMTRAMYRMAGSIGNSPIYIVPDTVSGKEEWLSPWGMVNRYRSNVEDDPEFRMLLAAREAYLDRDQAGFEKALNTFQDGAKRRLPGEIVLKDAALEIIYNTIDPFTHAKIAYGIAFLMCLAAVGWHARWLYLVVWAFAILGFVPHTFGLLARTLIMARPPVTNLYETFVFVAWASVLLGLVLEWLQKKSVGLLTAGIMGFAFLHIAGRYALEGDTMGMLTAVLNSNFWLGAHIITVSLGYAGCGAAGVVGHLYLIHRLFGVRDEIRLRSVAQSVYVALAFGLAFTTLGTVLGGMWADQSWGRFWGWDPKENGALLIVLWCAILLHAKAGGMVREIGMAAGAIVGLVLVMSAWIGVNLLGVGLHSYGFTSSGSAHLFSFVGFEAIFLAVTLAVLKVRTQNHAYRGAAHTPPGNQQ